MQRVGLCSSHLGDEDPISATSRTSCGSPPAASPAHDMTRHSACFAKKTCPLTRTRNNPQLVSVWKLWRRPNCASLPWTRRYYLGRLRISEPTRKFAEKLDRPLFLLSYWLPGKRPTFKIKPPRASPVNPIVVPVSAAIMYDFKSGVANNIEKAAQKEMNKTKRKYVK